MRLKVQLRQIILGAVLLPVTVSMGLMLGSCAAPKLRFKEAKLERIEILDSKWVLHFTITNPNLIGIPIDELQYRAYVAGTVLAEGKTRGEVLIRGKADSEVELPLQLPHLAVLSLARSLDGKKEVPYRITGSIRLAGLGIPFSHSGNYPIPPDLKEKLGGKTNEVKDKVEQGVRKLFKR